MDRSPDIVLTLTLLGLAVAVVAWCTGWPRTEATPPRGPLSDADLRRLFPVIAARMGR